MPDPAVRDAITGVYERRMGELSDKLAAGDIDLLEWQITMRQELRDSYALQLRAGADGPLTADDYLKMGNPLRSQYNYLAQFGRDIQAGDVQGGAIATRAKMYARSSGQMYWRQTTGDVELPAYPRDGSTPCKTNCGCEWLPNKDGSFTWVRGKEDSCEVCIEREKIWNPYVPARAA